jgi:hypothetical protein
MFTIFAIPKAFHGHIGVIQRNAITSWTLLHPRPEIILFGNDEGTRELASELELKHVPEIACNEFGTPLLNDLFQQAERRAVHQTLCYVNADIVLVDDFAHAVASISECRTKFLMIGQRWDMDVTETLSFDVPNWGDVLKKSALAAGRQQPPTWIDYFAFSKGFASHVLPFAIGRTRWDNWLIWHARQLGYPVIDASDCVTAIHQTHNYNHRPGGYNNIWSGEEAIRNTELAGGWQRHYTTEDATHRLDRNGLRVNLRRWSVRSQRAISHYFQPLWFYLLGLTRPIRHRLGIRQRPAA